MNAIILISLISLGHCTFLGSKKCTHGPLYWCSSVQRAKECGAINHCLTTVWANQRVGMTGVTETCFAAVEVLDVVRKLAHSNEEEALSHMAMGCTAISLEKRSYCKDLVQNDRDEVLLLLKSPLTSPALASALGLCAGFSDTVPHPKSEVNEQTNYCRDCINFFGDVRQMLNGTQDGIDKLFKDHLCNLLGPFKNVCGLVFETYVKEAYSIFIEQFDPQDICTLLQFCTNQTREEVLKKLVTLGAQKAGSNTTCALCKEAVQVLQIALNDSSVQIIVQNFVKNELCTMLPPWLLTKCEEYAADLPVIFQILLTTDSATLCAMASLCSSTSVLHLTAVHLGSSVTHVHTLADKANPKEGPECFLCKEVVGLMVKELANNASLTQITAALEKFCGLMPADVKDQCRAFVDEYTTLIMQLILQEVSPELVCTTLGLCLGNKQLKVSDPYHKVSSGEACTVCKLVANYIRTFIKDLSDQKEVAGLLERVCTFIPTNYQVQCVSIVDEYTPALLNILYFYDDPVKVCTEIKLCTPAAAPLLFKPMMQIQPSKTGGTNTGLVGAKECTWGPTYWCASIENARRCNVLEECKQKYGMKFNN